LADPALGAKQICPNCQAKFYDLGKRPAHCPKCANEFDPEEAVKFRRIRARTATPDYETDEEAEAQVKAKEAEAEEEEEEVVTPEIDQPGDEVLIPDEDGEVPETPDEAPAVTEIDIEDDVEIEEDDDSVPFIEEDEEGFEDDIEGLPEPGQEDR
jgi:uncharacterized protein (TIGR02300 family)